MIEIILKNQKARKGIHVINNELTVDLTFVIEGKKITVLKGQTGIFKFSKTKK